MIDDGGYLVLTNEATENNPHVYFLAQQQDRTKFHVNQFEPDIVKHLQKQKIFQYGDCSLETDECDQKTLQVS